MVAGALHGKWNMHNGVIQMLSLAIDCTQCGRRVHRLVDENCAPSYLRCTCGARFSLTVEQDPGADGLGMDGAWDEQGADEPAAPGTFSSAMEQMLS